MKIRVNGIPAPQGSKTRGRYGGVYESSKAVAPWREAIRTETQKQVNGTGPERGAVRISFMFYLPRPRGHYRTAAGHEHEVRPSAPKYPDHRPDYDKLLRALMDGLKAGGAYADDCQVVRSGESGKDWATDTEPPGVVVTLEPMP